MVPMLALGCLPGALTPVGANAQARDDGSSHDPRLRPTLLGYDPFEELLPGRFGFAVTAGTVTGNTGVTFAQVGALRLLAREDSLTVWDVLDVASSAADRGGLSAGSSSNGQVRMTVGFGDVAVALSAGGRAYVDVEVEERLLTLLTRGNLTEQLFDLTTSGARAMGTAEVGGHLTWRRLPRRSSTTLVLGGGARWVRPFGLVEASLRDGARVLVSADSVVARATADVYSTEYDGGPLLSDRLSDGSVAGGGFAFDAMARLEGARWAAEVAVQDLGTVTVGRVEHRSATTEYAVTSVDSLVSLIDDRRANAAGDTLAFVVQTVGDREIALPRTVRVRAAWEAASWLFLDGATGWRSERLGVRSRTEVGATLAPLRWLPVRGGLVLDDLGVGFAGSVGVDSRHFVLHVQASTLAGFLDRGRGVGATLRLALRS